MFFKIENLTKYSNFNCVTYYNLNYKSPKLYSYKNVIESVTTLNHFFLQCGIIKQNATIGLLFDHSPVIIPLILSILNNGNSFYFISDDDLIQVTKVCQLRGIQYVLADNALKLDVINSEVIKIERITIFENNVQLFKIRVTDPLQSMTNICYCVGTSGSTGQAKFVRVPFQCILPNIESLILKFDLNSNDTIVVISPTTFDPFIVDIFMGLTVGANLVFLDNSLRLSHSILPSFLFKNSEYDVTFMQCTPSYFKLFSIDQIKNSILSKSSSLKTLVFGGEKFPSSTVVKSWNTQKNIYNIYGITEVSCWATIEKWEASNVETSIGNPIDNETTLVVQSGELYIGSTTRICMIDNETPDIILANNIILRSTGDLVQQKNNRYYFKGRRDDSIKRFGIKLNLSDTENFILHLIPKIVQLKLIFYNQVELILFYKCEECDLITPDEIQWIINKNLKSYEIPSEIIKLDQFPLSHNGKLSHQMLTDLHCVKYFESRTNTKACDLFLSEIRKLDSMNENKRRKIDMLDISFAALGGKSFIALNIVMAIETRLRISTPKLLTILLDESKTVNDCLIYLKQFHLPSENTTEFVTHRESITSTIISKLDLKKCIDSTPSINSVDDKTIISVGSHSGIILNIETPNTLISQLQLPDRIESEIVIFNNKYGIVGCYNGHIYCYNVIKGEIVWSFNSHGMIKCRALIVNNLILFGNYNAKYNFYCIDGVNGKLNYRKTIGTKSIISNPVQTSNNYCIICTLDGTCEVINSLDGLSRWCIKLSSPIFSTPVVIDRRYILISEVEGIVHCLDENGNKIWNFKTDGNIFSSFEVETVTETVYCIYFGCYNKKLYGLEFNTSSHTITLNKESRKLKSSISSSPKLIKLDMRYYILVVVTVGIIYLLDVKSFEIVHQLELPGDIFSTPIIITANETRNDCNIVIGCRDNYLYLINFKPI